MLTPKEASQLDRWLTTEPDYYGPSTAIDDNEFPTNDEENQHD